MTHEKVNQKPLVVSIFGSNDATEGQEAYETARAAGRVLGELGYDIANGGYGGTMAASARGAKDTGASAIGVTCSLWSSDPNPYIDRVIETATLRERLETLVELGAGGYVVLPGATGTLVELGYVWELSCKGFLTKRPIVCVGEFWMPLIEMMDCVRPSSREFVTIIDSPQELAKIFRCG
ncbi:MAG: LOG family protein [Planctomycetota bacterium]|jgi:uncharacterized protein (TIGR00725 family)